MSSKTWVGVVAVLAVIVLGVLMVKGKKSPPTTNCSGSKIIALAGASLPTARIMYSDTGFSPASLKVPAGATVAFLNQTDQPVWVASASHPNHTNLPCFDALQGLGRDQVYEFTFPDGDETWSFHNHLNPSDKGKVIVGTVTE